MGAIVYFFSMVNYLLAQSIGGIQLRSFAISLLCIKGLLWLFDKEAGG